MIARVLNWGLHLGQSQRGNTQELALQRKCVKFKRSRFAFVKLLRSRSL